MAKFYSVTPSSDLDEFVDVAKKKFPNATAKSVVPHGIGDRAVQPDGRLLHRLGCLPAAQGSYNSWDFAKAPEWKPKPLPQPQTHTHLDA